MRPRRYFDSSAKTIRTGHTRSTNKVSKLYLEIERIEASRGRSSYSVAAASRGKLGVCPIAPQATLPACTLDAQLTRQVGQALGIKSHTRQNSFISSGRPSETRT